MAVLLKAKAFSVEETLFIVKGRKRKFDIIRKGAVSVIIPLLPDGRILLERQKRYAVGKFIYELPAGSVEKGEKPIDAAKRELEEETGYSSKEARLLFKGYSSPGISDEMLYFYLATGLGKGKMNRDYDETMSIRKITVKDAVKMIRNGEIIDTKTVAGILYYDYFCRPG